MSKQPVAEKRLVCRECGKEPENWGQLLGWTIIVGPAAGGPKRLKGSPFTCWYCTHKKRLLKP